MPGRILPHDRVRPRTAHRSLPALSPCSSLRPDRAVLPIPFDVLDLHATILILLVQLYTHTSGSYYQATKTQSPGDLAPWR